MRENNCSLAGQGGAWGLVDLNIPLHRLGNEAKVTQMVSQSKGMTPARGPGSACDSGHTRHREESSGSGVDSWPSLRKVSVLQEPWRFPGIQACVNTGFHSGGGKDLCPAAFCQHHPVEKNKMGEDSFCLNIRETLSAVTWAQYSKHVELSRVPPYPKQRVLAPAFVPFVFS